MASTKLVSLLRIEWATDIHGFPTMYITGGSKFAQNGLEMG